MKKCNNCKDEFEVDLELTEALGLTPNEVKLCDDCYWNERNNFEIQP